MTCFGNPTRFIERLPFCFRALNIRADLFYVVYTSSGSDSGSDGLVLQQRVRGGRRDGRARAPRRQQRVRDRRQRALARALPASEARGEVSTICLFFFCLLNLLNFLSGYREKNLNTCLENFNIQKMYDSKIQNIAKYICQLMFTNLWLSR